MPTAGCRIRTRVARLVWTFLTKPRKPINLLQPEPCRIRSPALANSVTLPERLDQWRNSAEVWRVSVEPLGLLELLVA